MSTSSKVSKSTIYWIIAGLCALAAIRVFVFAAAFPFFNNVDEQAHVDLVLKYAHADPPRSIEPFSPETARYLALYRTPEYFVPPQAYGGQYPPPNWLLPADDRQRVLEQEGTAWESRTNHESGEPPLYYGIAGAWFDIGRTVGFSDLTSLYWVRFLNVIFAMALVWIGYKAGLLVFGDQQFPAVATATLLAIWPQSSFYSIQGDSLAGVTFGFAFVATMNLLDAEQPSSITAVWAGLAVAATCLIKTANLPLIFVVLAALIFKTARFSREQRLTRGLPLLGAFAISMLLPIGLWFGWNARHFGDVTATKSKIELLGWTPKPFNDLWSHPIFTPTGAKDFWSELMASFWRGELIWHGERISTWWNDAFYWTVSTIALAIAIIFLLNRRRGGPRRVGLGFAVLSFAALVAFLLLLSIRFDFGDCPYPSREHPYFTSGRLLNAAAVPFFLVLAFAIDRIGAWTKRAVVGWSLLIVIALLALTWQVSLNFPALSSRYNFFHRQSIQ